MYVISDVMRERDVLLLADETLTRIAMCATTPIMVEVRKYIRSSGSKEVCDKLQQAFLNVSEEQKFLESSRTKEAVAFLQEIDFSSVSENLSIQELDRIIQSITYIIDSPYARPYIKPVESTDLAVLLNEIELLADVDDRLKPFSKNIKSYRSYFRDPVGSRYKGTVVKKIVLSKEKYLIIKRGCEFMKNCKVNSIDAVAWRHL